MSGHTGWEKIRKQILDTPERRARYEAVRDELRQQRIDAMAQQNPPTDGNTTISQVYTPDLAAIQELIDGGYITRRKHNTEDLFIYNYTPKTQYSRNWNSHTRACRGLILDGSGNVVARPFSKFFNIGEIDSELDASWVNEPYEVYEKLDGSLGVLYFTKDGPAIASRGAFHSEQATMATAILRDKYANSLPYLDHGLTYLFEIIYPENRIVVDYGNQRDIILLAVIRTSDGIELPNSEFNHLFPVVQKYTGLEHSELQNIQRKNGTNREGYVLRFESGVRAKLKIDEYVRIQRLITSMTPRLIWQRLATGEDISSLMVGCPPHYQEWVRNQAQTILNKYSVIESECQSFYANRPVTNDRRTVAAYFANHPYKSVLFLMLDGRPYSELIWKTIYPPASDPFKVEA